MSGLEWRGEEGGQRKERECQTELEASCQCYFILSRHHQIDLNCKMLIGISKTRAPDQSLQTNCTLQRCSPALWIPAVWRAGRGGAGPGRHPWPARWLSSPVCCSPASQAHLTATGKQSLVEAEKCIAPVNRALT
jgi:hypothetical protein